MHYSFFKKCRHLLFILFSSSLISSALAEPIIISHDTLSSINLHAHAQIYIDETNTVSIDNILTPNRSLSFRPSQNNTDNFGFRSAAFWFKVELNNTLNTEQLRLLEFNSPLLDKIEIYLIHGLSKRILSHHQVGDLQAFSNRPYPHSNFVIPLTLPAQSNSLLFYKIKSTSPIVTKATLWQSETFSIQSRMSLAWVSLCIGILLSLISINLVLFAFIRKVSFLYFSLLVSSMLLTLGSFNGLWFELFWPNLPHWHGLSYSIGLALSGIFAAQFSRSFLHTSSNLPKLDNVFYILIFTFILYSIVSPFISQYALSAAIGLLLLVLSLTAILTGAILSRKGNRIAKIYLIAWLAFFIGLLLSTSNIVNSFPEVITGSFAMTLGSLIYAVILSIALVYRIKISHITTDQIREKIAAESEVKVAGLVEDRTQELTSINKKLLQQEDILKKLAFYDSLTGLANRTFLLEQLEHLISQSKRNNTKLAILFIDIDNFKAINDQYGHPAGDEILTITADRLRSILRDDDVLGRLNCDKFIVILESVQGDKHNPIEVADKIKQAIAEPISIDWFIAYINTSIGIAHYPKDGNSAKSLIAAADSAMSHDKANKKPKNQ